MSIKERAKDLGVLALKRPSAQNVALKLTTLARFVDWCQANPCPVVDTRRSMHEHVMKEIEVDKPVTFLEFGVYEGESFRWWVESCGDPHSRFVGFDTFRGLPEDWHRDIKKGHFDVDGKQPQYDDSRVRFVAGLFQDTLPEFVHDFQRMEQRTVVHLDADLFSATLFVLIWMLPMLRKGDILIFDEFHDYMDEFHALECALRAYSCELETIVATPGYAGRGYAQVAAVIK